MSQLWLLFKRETAIRLKIINTNNKTHSQKASQETVRSHGSVLKPTLKNGGAA